jgi:adenylate cyclase
MEIERKYIIDKKNLPVNLEDYPSRHIEQGYLCTAPVVRIRRDNDAYYLTYKSKGLMVREEYNLPLSAEAYHHLKPKTDGKLIIKTRYMIPLDQDLTIELDIFQGEHESLILAEIEFADELSANTFIPPSWFGEDVTFSPRFQNSTLSK